MPFGKIFVDELEDSNGDVLDILEVTSGEATTTAKGYMSAADKTKLDGIQSGGGGGLSEEDQAKLDKIIIDGVDTTVTASYSSVSVADTLTAPSFGSGALELYAYNGNSNYSYIRLRHDYSPYSQSAIDWRARLLSAAVAGLEVSVTMQDGTSHTFVVGSQYDPPYNTYSDSSSTLLYLYVENYTASEYYDNIASIEFSGSTYTATLTGTDSPLFDASRPVVIGGQLFEEDDLTSGWTVSGTSATKDFTNDISATYSGSISLFQQPRFFHSLSGANYELARDTLAVANGASGLMSGADKAKVDAQYSDARGNYYFTDATTLSKLTSFGDADDNVVIGENNYLDVSNFYTYRFYDNNVVIGYGNLGNGARSNAAHGSMRYNVAIGYNSMSDCSGGYYNVAIGFKALECNTSSSASTSQAQVDYNTAVGMYAGRGATGDYNTFIGKDAGYNSYSTGNNTMCLGYRSGTGQSPSGDLNANSNIICLGNNSITDIYCADTTISSSDARDKADVEDFIPGLSFITAMRPVTYRWDKRTSYLPEEPEISPDIDGDIDPGIDPENPPEPEVSILDITPDGTHKKPRLNLGFLSQEVEAIEKQHGYATDANNRLISTMNADDTAMGLKYERLVPILVNAIKELSSKNEDLEARIAQLEL